MAIKKIKLDWEKLVTEIVKQGKSVSGVSIAIGRSQGYLGSVIRKAKKQDGIEIYEKVEELISHELGCEPETFVAKGLPTEQKKEETVDTVYASIINNQRCIVKKLESLERSVNALAKRFDTVEGNTEIIRSKSNVTVAQLAKLKDVIDELNDGSSDDTIEEIKRLLESKMIIANGCERGKAYELLEEYVKDRNGIKQSKLYALADEHNIPRKDIIRAKNEMGLKVISKGYGDNTEKYWYKE